MTTVYKFSKSESIYFTANNKWPKLCAIVNRTELILADEPTSSVTIVPRTLPRNIMVNN